VTSSSSPHLKSNSRRRSSHSTMKSRSTTGRISRKKTSSLKSKSERWP